MAGKKICVLDTSVVMHRGDAINTFDDNDVWMHGGALEELDRLKHHKDKGYDAREAIRHINEYAEKGFLAEGVPTPGGGKFFVGFTLDKDFKLLPTGLEPNNDNRMILLAKKLQKEHPDYKVIFVSKDIKPRATANACGILAEDYRHDIINKVYTGTAVINLAPGSDDLIAKFFKEKFLVSSDVFARWPLKEQLFPNQCCYLNAGAKSALAIFKKKDGCFQLVQVARNAAETSIFLKNSEQVFAWHLLTDPGIDLVTLRGPAGTAKTLLSIAAGWKQVDSRYSQLHVFRPTYELGDPLGFLPGTLTEKFQPWTKPVYDAFEVILNLGKKDANLAKKKGGSQKPEGVYSIVQGLIDHGLLDISPINFLQGCNLRNEFVVIDESQNFKRDDIKKIVARPAEGTKLVLNGDPDQIANERIDSKSNGFVHLIETYKHLERVAHLEVRNKVYRSYLAEISQLL